MGPFVTPWLGQVYVNQTYWRYHRRPGIPTYPYPTMIKLYIYTFGIPFYSTGRRTSRPTHTSVTMSFQYQSFGLMPLFLANTTPLSPIKTFNKKPIYQIPGFNYKGIIKWYYRTNYSLQRISLTNSLGDSFVSCKLHY